MTYWLFRNFFHIKNVISKWQANEAGEPYLIFSELYSEILQFGCPAELVFFLNNLSGVTFIMIIRFSRFRIIFTVR